MSPPARLAGASADRGAGGLGRGEQRAEERKARHLPGLRRGEVRRDDGAHRMRDDVRTLDPGPLHEQGKPFEEELQGERPFDPMRAPRSGQIESNRPVAREGREHGREGIGGSAETMDHDHRLALAFDLHGHALDEHRSSLECRGAASAL
jgi:hypothetical protein